MGLASRKIEWLPRQSLISSLFIGQGSVPYDQLKEKISRLDTDCGIIRVATLFFNFFNQMPAKKYGQLFFICYFVSILDMHERCHTMRGLGTQNSLIL